MVSLKPFWQVGQLSLRNILFIGQNQESEKCVDQELTKVSSIYLDITIERIFNFTLYNMRQNIRLFFSLT